MHGPQVGVCRVCGEMTDAFSNAQCMQCGESFHLALRQDVPGKDCGQVWINDESQTLEFACSICLGHVPEPSEQAAPSSAGRYARSEGARASEILRQKRRSRRR